MFTGFVVSDWPSVAELIQHGVAGSRAEAGERALEAGVDMDMVAGIYLDSIAPLVRANRIPMAVVDSAVKRVLRAKARLGLLTDPYRDATAPTPVEARAFARHAAQEPIVLLQNERGQLTLA